MAFQPKIYGRIKDDADQGVESGTLTLTPNAFEFTQNSDYHPNGNVITWKFKGTLAELRAKANAISKQTTELGSLGSRSVVTMNYRGIGGFTIGNVENGIGHNSAPYYPEYRAWSDTMHTLQLVSVPVGPIRNTNPYDVDGGATLTLRKLEYTWAHSEYEDPAKPPFLLVYGMYSDNRTFFYIGALQLNTDESHLTKAVYDALPGTDMRFESYYALYLIPATSADNPPLSANPNGEIWWKATDRTELIKQNWPKFFTTWRGYLGFTNTADYGYCGTITQDVGGRNATLGGNMEGYGMTLTYDTEYRTYAQSNKSPLYECTVQKTYYSYSVSNAHRVKRSSISSN